MLLLDNLNYSMSNYWEDDEVAKTEKMSSIDLNHAKSKSHGHNCNSNCINEKQSLNKLKGLEYYPNINYK